jgi:hypothetical protein
LETFFSRRFTAESIKSVLCISENMSCVYARVPLAGHTDKRLLPAVPAGLRVTLRSDLPKPIRSALSATVQIVVSYFHPLLVLAVFQHTGDYAAVYTFVTTNESVQLTMEINHRTCEQFCFYMAAERNIYVMASKHQGYRLGVGVEKNFMLGQSE